MYTREIAYRSALSGAGVEHTCLSVHFVVYARIKVQAPSSLLQEGRFTSSEVGKCQIYLPLPSHFLSLSNKTVVISVVPICNRTSIKGLGAKFPGGVYT